MPQEGPPRTRAQAAAERSEIIQAQLNIGEDEDEDENDSGEESEEDEDGFGKPPPVLSISCAACDGVLTQRGMSVFLVADGSTLYSTDIPSDSLRVAGTRTIPTCECRAEDVRCGGCESIVGYHVLQPCSLCGSAEHNGHFWLFDEAAVNGTERGIKWDALPYNGEDELAAAAQAAEAEAEEAEAEACPVCASSPMWRPVRFATCGHRFCYGCASREVDMRGACPLDRRPATRADLVSCGGVGPAVSPG